MLILGIETSCDETAAAVVEDGLNIHSNVVSSQVKLHSGYGGVVPELAAREHLRNIRPVVESALTEASVTIPDIDAVAVTSSPGLVPALLVGLSYGKGLALGGSIPLVAVNHFLAHVFSCFLDHPQLVTDASLYPLVALVVSGGHTNLVVIEADGVVRFVGRTVDDAAGEAFDKGAKIMGLGYPGGPVIDRLAKQGDASVYRFPRGFMGEGGKPVSDEDRLNFSFSGVKTSLLYRLGKEERSEADLADFAASYQAAIVDVLVAKMLMAADKFSAKTLLMCGGVACNSALRARAAEASEEAGKKLLIASPKYCTDNAAMVGGSGYYFLRAGHLASLDEDAVARLPETMDAVPFAPNFDVNA
jgi:N6-L-threonylcarbamoyladenine synthase